MTDSRSRETKILKDTHLMTKLQIWHPKYSTKHSELAEPVVLLAKSKVYHASPTILVEFTKAKSLRFQRFCISRADAQTYPEETNGKITCLAVPIHALSNWKTVEEDREEIRHTIEQLGWWTAK
jgi:hypothetical protein